MTAPEPDADHEWGRSMTETVWVTKYALTTGVIAATFESQFNEKAICVYAGPSRGNRTEMYHLPHWHRSRDAAVAHAEEMRVAKIASLQKQAERLRKMAFRYVDVTLRQKEDAFGETP